MVLKSNGSISFSDIQSEFGGKKPISLSEYYKNDSGKHTFNVQGIPNKGSPISLNQFHGKKKIVLKTVTLQTGNFNAPGSPGKWLGYISPGIKIPNDFKQMKKWSLKLVGLKNWTPYGFAYPYIGLKNSAGKQLAVVSVSPGSHTTHWFTRELNNRTNSLGNAGDTIHGFLDFFSYSNITNAHFVLTMEYYA